MSMGAPSTAIEVALLTGDLPVDTFDTMQARCFSPIDQQRLLATVEAAAGGIDGFNKCVRPPRRRGRGVRTSGGASRVAPTRVRSCARPLAARTRRYVRAIISRAMSHIAGRPRTANRHRLGEGSRTQSQRGAQACRPAHPVPGTGGEMLTV